ncbi:hypothetical protein FJZ18_02060 [Candidatus Pacearchaeota archaeon]|nr:hypothetical protein [Candidatus Pacearchaeota archaeon]
MSHNKQRYAIKRYEIELEPSIYEKLVDIIKTGYFIEENASSLAEKIFMIWVDSNLITSKEKTDGVKSLSESMGYFPAKLNPHRDYQERYGVVFLDLAGLERFVAELTPIIPPNNFSNNPYFGMTSEVMIGSVLRYEILDHIDHIKNGGLSDEEDLS